MLYVCSCGFTAATATAFYRHLAASKESGVGHQLTQARFSNRTSKASERPDDVSKPAGQAVPGNASGSDEYLMVDQRENTFNGPTVVCQPQVPLPVSSMPQAAMAGRVPRRPPDSSELDDVPLRDLQGALRAWSGFSRQHSSSQGRPPLHPAQPSEEHAAEAQVLTSLLDSDEMEIVEHVPNPQPSTSVMDQIPGGGSHAVNATQAALRMSGSVVNAMVVGLSPWRWFGNGSPSKMEAVEPGAQQDSANATAGDDEDKGQAVGVTDEEVISVERAAQLPLNPPVASLEALHAVRDVLIWRNPWCTSRVFGTGLYLAVCSRQLTQGHDLLQPSTALFAICFAVLLRNVVRAAVAKYTRSQQQKQQQALGILEADYTNERFSPRQEVPDEQVERRKAAMLLQQRLESMLQGVALGAARYGAALLVLGWGLLSGRRPITAALVASLLWLGMVLGELRIISQPMFWLLCYVAAFTIPAAYYRCRGAMDAGVEAVLRFVARVLLSCSRIALLSASTVAALLLALLPYNFVLRASLAVTAAFGVLLLQTEAGGRRWRHGSVGLVMSGQLLGSGPGVRGGSGKELAGDESHVHRE